MKYLLLIIELITFSLFSFAQTGGTNLNQPDSTKKMLIVEASCGQCQFGLHGKGCNLAIRIDGHAYFVAGADIDAYGDAHAKDGFCEAIRMAEVQGELIDNKFRLSYFQLKKE